MSTYEKLTTSLTTRQRVPFEKEVLKFLLKNEKSISSRVVWSFVYRYAKWLYDCVDKKVTILPGGEIELARWTPTEGGSSYGFDPASIASNLDVLNAIFYAIMGNAYIRMAQPEKIERLPPLNVQLSIEVLKGLAPGLGFYVLVHYFATGASNQDQAWIERACDLFGEFRDVETWRPGKELEESYSVKQVIGTGQLSSEPYYHTAFPKFIRGPDPRKYQLGLFQMSNGDPTFRQGYDYGYRQGHRAGYDQCLQETNSLFTQTAIVIECERKRLVSFLKSLRQTLAALNVDPLVVEDGVQMTTPDGKPTNGYRASS